MSRVAKSPIEIPSGVNFSQSGQELTVKGSKGELKLNVHPLVLVEVEGSVVQVKPHAESQEAWAMAGTFRSLVNNMVTGVNSGFERKLELIGVGYRAQAKGNVLSLTLGFSHPVEYQLPEGVTAETPTQTEVVLKSANKQLLGQVAANVRAFRPPEPYKGKGVRYSDEQVLRKEAKKK
ncbi:50S ribosomal protein L6 [Ketobacter sp. MCCC 1A13808]|uniref:50S ribosomal protein L6 n=1 Tax=Ketobacter sp. MCCC 1A13808 TaxID=2602738 RepID=UPI000F2C3A2C|nr:50S ribosomal protein L6 [Ketobacter sp. MCCC 1A13808]MVF14592.1 50S ribosomal protein L6 [Ketobacter sp. MCCC 1A13808]RLP52574.1 MAG: 50S ribosomal protein L6 [Ketobacter sp.]